MNLRVFGGEIERIEPKRPRPIVTVSMLSLKNRGCIVNCNLPETVDLIKFIMKGYSKGRYKKVKTEADVFYFVQSNYCTKVRDRP